MAWWVSLDGRDYALMIGLGYLGHWYKWGGDDPSGFDCSGFALEVMTAVGKLPRGIDMTAAGMYAHFERERKQCSVERALAQPGCLVFWGQGTDPVSIHHVEMSVGNGLSIGASGGNSTTLTLADAAAQNAFIKVRPIAGRKGAMFAVDPFMG